MNWYRKAQLIDGKKPWQMTQQDFLNYHYTGFISSDAYSSYKTKEGLDWLKKQNYPVLYEEKVFDGVPVEFRKTGKKLQYAKQDPNNKFGLLRNPDGDLIYMTDEEIKKEGLPTHDQTIVAFVGDDAIGWASNEFGATGVWVIDKYQGKGIGTYLLKEFRKTMKPEHKMGQMTQAGIELTKAYHRDLVKQALEENKPVPEEVLKDYPELMGKERDLDYWIWKIKKNPLMYFQSPQNVKEAPEIRDFMINLYVDEIKNDPYPRSIDFIPKDFKNAPEIQGAYKKK
jgi:GNAT superfamily N-acetyltransferase